MRILIKNASIVHSNTPFLLHIGIENGSIKSIDSPVPTESFDRVIDAEGKFVFPGGVDPHVHFQLPTPAGPSSDDFKSGSIAALLGGTTSILDFVTPHRGQSLVEALEIRLKEAQGSFVDYSLHVSPVEWRDSTEAEIKACFDAGFPSFKVYMAYRSNIGLNNEVLFNVLSTVGKLGGMVTVHAEMGDEIDHLRDTFLAEGKSEPLYHLLSRPPHTESEAVRQVIDLAHIAECPLYIVHVSSEESLAHISAAQERGQVVFAETCPHYLLLNDTKYHGSFEQVAPYVISPPLRKASDNEALWNALQQGVVQTVGTDHCPFNLSQKAAGESDFRKIPNGAGGVEHRLPLLYSYGVQKEKLTKQQFIDITSSNAAQVFGCWPQKGSITVGADADLVIWDSQKKNTIHAATHKSNADTEMFEGFETTGAPEFVIKGGRIVVENGELISVNLEPGKILVRSTKR